MKLLSYIPVTRIAVGLGVGTLIVFACSRIDFVGSLLSGAWIFPAPISIGLLAFAGFLGGVGVIQSSARKLPVLAITFAVAMGWGGFLFFFPLLAGACFALVVLFGALLFGEWVNELIHS